MIVYGDPQFEESSGALLSTLRANAENAPAKSLAGLRAILIQAGQIEQSFADHESTRRCGFERVTDLAAEGFYDALASVTATLPRPVAQASPSQLKKLIEECRAAAYPRNVRVRVKVPEGFEFYALYPEQYTWAARQWAAANPGAGKVLVVGLRSIGTTLSAVVATTLKAAGLDARRCTVRPAGHPFHRTVVIDQHFVSGCSHAIIVDEGPGLSGSSMAAVAAALVEAGMSPKTISFFPGSDSEPGPAATDAVRRWWHSTVRFFVPLDHVRWGDANLEEILARKSAELCHSNAAFNIEDLSGGGWRHHNGASCPAVAAQFERRKFLFRSENGLALHWKFIGLGAFVDGLRTAQEVSQDRCQKLGRWTPQPLGFCEGFMATPWILGQRLTVAEAKHAIPTVLAYIADATAEELAPPDPQAAMTRLAEMLFWNAKQALGEEFAQKVYPLADAARNFRSLTGYGDGHLAPHEWIRDASGNILKTDCFGHQTDHTLIGRQSVLWDVAGAACEWSLGEPEFETVAQQFANPGQPTDRQVLAFYRAAYAAFRLGQFSLCLQSESNAMEQERLGQAVAKYRAELSLSLQQS